MRFFRLFYLVSRWSCCRVKENWSRKSKKKNIFFCWWTKKFFIWHISQTLELPHFSQCCVSARVRIKKKHKKGWTGKSLFEANIGPLIDVIAMLLSQWEPVFAWIIDNRQSASIICGQHVNWDEFVKLLHVIAMQEHLFGLCERENWVIIHFVGIF